MLQLYRRHVRSCPQSSRRARRCRCPLWVQGTLGGERIRRALDLSSWEAGTDLVRGWEASGKIGQVRPEVPTIGEAIARFIEDAEARKLAWETMRKLRRTLGQFRDWCEGKGIRQLGQLSVDDLRTFRASLEDSALTQLKKIERLRSFFRFCIDAGWIEKNPAKALKPPKAEPNPTLPFTEDEFRKIVAACDRYPDEYGRLGTAIAQRMKALVLLMRHSGLRIQDAVCLPKSALNGMHVFLYTQKTGVPVKVPILEEVADFIRAIPSASNEYFFWTGNGKRTSVAGKYQERLRRLFKLAQVPEGHSHRFRDTFASFLLLAGLPTETVAILLGNSPKIVEKHYSPWIQSRQNVLEDAVRRAWNQKAGTATGS